MRCRKIVIHPVICNGQPTIEGTRIAVRTVLEFLSAGDGIDDVLAEYPSTPPSRPTTCSPVSRMPPGS